MLDSELDSQGFTVLHVAAARDKDKFARLLLERGASVDVR